MPTRSSEGENISYPSSAARAGESDIRQTGALTIKDGERQYTWNGTHTWRYTGEVVMLVQSGMQVCFERDGAYRIRYTANIEMGRHEWWYMLDAYDSVGTKLFTVSQEPVEHGRGPVEVSLSYTSTEVLLHFDDIWSWERRGIGRYWN